MSTARPRVLIDATTLRGTSGLRGIGRYLRELLLGLDGLKRGGELPFEVVALAQFALGGEGLTEDLSAVVDASHAVAGSSGASQQWLRRALLPTMAAEARVDLVHIPEAVGTPFYQRIPTVVTCHDLIPLRFADDYLPSIERAAAATRAERVVSERVRHRKDHRRYHRARRVVAISEQTRRDLVELLSVSPAMIDVVHNGITLSRYGGAGEVPRPQADPYLLYVGFCDPRKNIPGLFETLRRVNRERPIDLLWAGSLKGGVDGHMLELARRHGVEGRVKLLGYVHDDTLVALYRHAEALVFLSRAEGFGIPVVEAMAAGCPVVVARDSGSDELVGDAGLIVSPDDADESAKAVRKVLTDPSLAARLRSAGPPQAARFSADAMARGYVASWERALRDGPHPRPAG